MALRSRRLCPPTHAGMTSTDYNSEDFQSELFPLHSPLLRESLLVSFPPPSYMLKFSGYSWLIGGPIGFETNLHIKQKTRYQNLTSRLLGVQKDGFVSIWRTQFAVTQLASKPKDQVSSEAHQHRLWHPHSRPTPTHSKCRWWGWTDTPTDILPKRKCKLRSKFWWLTGFCNSHDVSHFAAFFIVVGAKTSVAESVNTLSLSHPVFVPERSKT